jgi:hypothetical protein
MTADRRRRYERVTCEACLQTEPLRVYDSLDGTIWESYPPGWLLFLRNGVIIPACSEECAEAYVGGFDNRPVTPDGPRISLESRLGDKPCPECGRQGYDGVFIHAIGCSRS